LQAALLPGTRLAASFEPLVLALLSGGPTYGYEIIQRIQALSDGRILYAANRLYPLLHDLENRGLVDASWQHDGPGPGRKYYHLTGAGKKAVAQAKRDWLDVHALLAHLWGPGPALAT
jgi:DNA-binding PadR family transcriptional regulator